MPNRRRNPRKWKSGLAKGLPTPLVVGALVLVTIWGISRFKFE